MKKHYFLYAIGEIALVIVGILIALQVDTWRAESADEEYERLLLSEIETSLSFTRQGFDVAYLPRLQDKEMAISELMTLVADNEQVSDPEFTELLRRSAVDFRFSFEAGAYEALKNSGIDRLSNDQLRSLLITTYESSLPRISAFISINNEEADAQIIPLRQQILSPKLERDGSGNFAFEQKVIVEDVLNHPAFLRILELEAFKASNQRRRLESITDGIDGVLESLRAELAEQ